jgi:hypothetical protein
MSAQDPFPAVAYQAALRKLRDWLGEKSVRWDEPFGPALLMFPSVNGVSRLRRFTWQQAKYLALNPRTYRTIIVGKYPTDWPA